MTPSTGSTISVPTPLGALIAHAAGPANGPTALLWPSLFSDGHMSWGAQLGGLHRLGWRTLTVDPCGTGASAPPRRLFTMEECAAAAVQLLDESKTQRAAIIGLSWGGFVALRVGLSHPDRVVALILSNTSARRMPWLARQRDKQLAALVRLGIPAKPGKAVAKQMLGRNTIRRDPELAVRFAAAIDGLERLGLSYAMRSVLADRTDIAGQLARMTAPTLVIDGADDRAFTRAHSRELADRIPGARLKVVPGAGHLTPREAEDDVTALMIAFLAELNPQGNVTDNHTEARGFNR